MSSRLLCLFVTGCLATSAPAAAGQGAKSVVPGETQPTAVGCDPPRNEWFRDRGFFDPLIADVRAPQISFNYPAWAPELPHSYDRGTRPVWEVSVGKELPLFVRANYTEATKLAGCAVGALG